MRRDECFCRGVYEWIGREDSGDKGREKSDGKGAWRDDV